ncbi:hypothetical protein MIR68_009007 [Amoeboaphelidium protococcarum]|nr:hypothetical protein MIR68_009007 [Amoeboaphelidium protococcarum]
MRLDKPIGTNLLYIPCTWSILMAQYSQKDHALNNVQSGTIDYSQQLYDVLSCSSESIKMLTLFGVGAVVMRGAGCTNNDMWDRDFDSKVERTRNRPIASNQISMKEAWGFLGLQLTTGLGVLTQLNMNSIILGASSLPLVGLYPLAKRVTKYPQFVLGLTFNWGALLGWCAMTDTVDLSVCLPLYGAGICWTLIYDTIYAHQDKHDDAKVGIKSTALTFAHRTKTICTGLNCMQAVLFFGAGINNDQSFGYFSSLILSSIYMQSLIQRVNLNSVESCNQAFRKSQYAGWLISLGVIVDILIKAVVLT